MFEYIFIWRIFGGIQIAGNVEDFATAWRGPSSLLSNVYRVGLFSRNEGDWNMTPSTHTHLPN
jgi:hypothetical protein